VAAFDILEEARAARFRRRRLGKSKLEFSLFGCRNAALFQRVDRLFKGLDIGKRAIDGGKPDVGDVVEAAEGIHRKFSQNVRWNLWPAVPIHPGLDVADDSFELSDGDIAFRTGVSEAAEDLFARELLAAAVPLEDLDCRELNSLDGAESLATSDALAPTADAIIVGPAIGHLGVAEVAKRAAHRLT
jgi:hypothetical protein